ncbi:colicin-like bacteriocin tRNase domain-containing protein [Klebsiella pneumoniae]|uniref:colicin-like bacteriocin tRNase domain-containing protein n=1 Tax=Klebsiella pneumoniae TaxID=573 RepID=UPI0022B641CD|nr:colicin-like bacteriocin tRNase domain-containing protein [Klebsiella pneumoniae]
MSAAVADVLAALKGRLSLVLWGIAIYGVLPSEIAKDDPKMMSKELTSVITADAVTETRQVLYHWTRRRFVSNGLWMW